MDIIKFINYTIKLRRESFKLFSSDIKYMCILDIYNSIGSLVLSLNCNDYDITKLLENIIAFMQVGYQSTITHVTNVNINMNQYLVEIGRCKEDDKLLMKIVEFNALNNIFMERLNININEFEDMNGINNLCDFYNALYYTFLKDIKECWYLEPSNIG